jgi:WD40 repeat protein
MEDHSQFKVPASTVLTEKTGELIGRYARRLRSWAITGFTERRAFSQDGRWSLSVGWDGVSTLREMNSEHEMHSRLAIPKVNDVTFSPDGQFFAIASSAGYGKLWETAALREVATFRGFLMGVHSAAFSPDGTIEFSLFNVSG